MNPKLIIFDMDGTVLDTLEDLLDAMNYALAKCGYPLRTLAEMRTFVGNGLRMMAVRAVPAGTDEAGVENVFRTFKEYYAGHLNIHTRPYDGIVPLLERLRARGVLTAISSNKFDAGAKLLADIHFGGLIDLTVGESEARPRKPDPAGALYIMKELGAKPSETLYVGDSSVDIQTAKNAGLDIVCVAWGFQSPAQLEQAGASKIVFDINQLESCFSG